MRFLKDCKSNETVKICWIADSIRKYMPMVQGDILHCIRIDNSGAIFWWNEKNMAIDFCSAGMVGVV